MRSISVYSVLAVVCGVLLATSALAGEVEVIMGSWDWPDSGLLVYGTIPGPYDMTIHSDGAKQLLIVGGEFHKAGDVPAEGLAAWNGETWKVLDAGVDLDRQVFTLLPLSNDLYAAGSFTSIGGVAAKRVARWDGESWFALGDGTNGRVWSLAWDQANQLLYAGGSFTGVEGHPAKLVAKWDGFTWSALGSGIGAAGQGTVYAVALFDDGNGLALYAGGFFEVAGGKPAASIAKWDGENWSPLAGGIPGGFVQALAVFDDGTGPALYVGGIFDAVDNGAIPASNLARWNGTAWSPVAGGTPGQVTRLKVMDDGSGPALFASGQYLYKWNGMHWTSYEPAPGLLYAMEFFDGGLGRPTLHVGGAGIEIDGVQTNIARFTHGFSCGDFNNDGVTDQADLGILLAAFNCPGPGCQGDADGDGDTDQADLGILLKFYGQKCG